MLAVVLGAGLIVAAAAAVGTRGPNVDRTQPDHAAATKEIVAIEQLRLSDQLADFGEQHADAIALIEAARILKQANAVLKPVAATAPGARTWESLLTRASQLGSGNPTLAGLIADVRALKVRNIPTVPADASLLNKSVKQRGADRVEVRFKAGESAMVYVRPVAAVDLDL